ncbi:MAG: hypothetical protein LBK96_02560, partial [Prevotellaceae bacterium]|nr:hypothetical protein [Prevotellaceae bacterium]
MNIESIIKPDARIDDSVILDCFGFQYDNCELFRKYVELLDVNVSSVGDIPFLPVRFFKTNKIYSSPRMPETVFTSSGTGGMDVSKHCVADAGIYKLSYTSGFRYFFGDISGYAILALLPSYLERQGSSLIAMVQGLMEISGNPLSGFFLNNHGELFETLQVLKRDNVPALLFGVSFALLDFLEKFRID